MAKSVRGLVIESEYVIWGVEYTVEGETFTYEALDEDDARLVRASLDGTLMARQVFETGWADA